MSSSGELLPISELLSDNELKEHITCHQQIFDHPPEKETQEIYEDWLQWCHQNKNVKVIEYEVPAGILPPSLSGSLMDIKVECRGPDDALYNRSPEIREKVARGNTLLSLRNAANNTRSLEMVVFALRKFTGGMGDEDESQPEDETVWKKYFLKPLEETDKIVVTTKENGEAAHLSVRYIDNQFYFIGGSKNVHMIFRSREDIERYTESRFGIAKVVCHTIMDLIDSIEYERRKRLVSLLVWSKMTVIMELLQPTYQHVVDLSYLSKPDLKFLCFTEMYRPYLDVNNQHSLTSLPPHTALEIGKLLGLHSTNYEVIKLNQFEDKMTEIRQGEGYEGAVAYFLDDHNNTIGLLKKKTIWYVLLRAIREKISYAVVEYKKNPAAYKESARLKNKQKIEKRLDEIQKWLNLTDQQTKHWKTLGAKFLFWIISKVSTKSGSSVYGSRDKFPMHWKQFLEETGLSEQPSSGVHVQDMGGDVEMLDQSVVDEEPVKLLEPETSSPSIRLEQPLGTTEYSENMCSVMACVFRNVDLVGKNSNKCRHIIDRINSKSLKNKKQGWIVIMNHDKLHEDVIVKTESDNIDFNLNTLAIYHQNKLLASPQGCEDTNCDIDEETLNVIAVIATESKDLGEKTLNTCIQQFYHSGIGSRYSAGKGVHVEKVQILHSSGDVEAYPKTLNISC